KTCCGASWGGGRMVTVIPLSQSPFPTKAEKPPPPRQSNQASRRHEHLTPDEVERMIAAAHQAGGRVAERDALLIMMAYRHGLRASELAGLRWDQIGLKAGAVHLARRQNGLPPTHPLPRPELRALGCWKRQQD